MIISRYLTREIMNALLAVTFILLLAFLSQQVVRYLNYVTTGKITTNILLQLVSFEVPYLLAVLMPLGLYLGILIAMGRLYADNEMAIMQLCGFNNKKILHQISLVAFFVSIFVLVLMLWINPWISIKREQLIKNDTATAHLLQLLIPGRFKASPDGNYVVYIEKISRDHQRAENVFLAHAKDLPTTNSTKPDLTATTKVSQQTPWMVLFASEGYQIKNPRTQDQFFVTADGYRYEGTPGQNDYRIIQFKTHSVRIPISEDRTPHDQSEVLSFSHLWKNAHDPKQAAELQWRFSIPIATFLLGLFAVPLSAVRPRQGRYLTLLPAMMAYIIYMNMLFIARHWTEQGKVPVYIGMWWVHGIVLLCLLLMSWLAFRKRTKRS